MNQGGHTTRMFAVPRQAYIVTEHPPQLTKSGAQTNTVFYIKSMPVVPFPTSQLGVKRERGNWLIIDNESAKAGEKVSTREKRTCPRGENASKTTSGAG